MYLSSQKINKAAKEIKKELEQAGFTKQMIQPGWDLLIRDGIVTVRITLSKPEWGQCRYLDVDLDGFGDLLDTKGVTELLLKSIRA